MTKFGPSGYDPSGFMENRGPLPRSSTILLLLLFALCAGSPATAAADEADPERQVHVVEQRPFLQALRFEMTPMFGYTVNETMYEYLQVGGFGRFHITEEWSVGGVYEHYFSGTTDTYEDVQDTFQLFPEKALIRWYAGGEVLWSPLYAKAIVFGSWIVHWNLYLTVGAGVTQTGPDGLHVTGTVGGGARFFLTEWLTFNVEVRDHIYVEPYKAGDEIINNLVLHTGFGFFLPFGWEYTHPK